MCSLDVVFFFLFLLISLNFDISVNINDTACISTLFISLKSLHTHMTLISTNFD